jgi:hypothetical protein
VAKQEQPTAFVRMQVGLKKKGMNDHKKENKRCKRQIGRPSFSAARRSYETSAQCYNLLVEFEKSASDHP